MAFIKRPLIGVNLGGWLVLEPWMTPSLFAGTGAVDEYTFCQDSSRHTGLKRFRDTFITRNDFEWLASQNIEAVRLPVGYWLFGKQKPFPSTYKYVDKVFEWAAEFNIKVLLGLHGAPGSQNGKMHSGRSGSVEWPLTENIEATIEVLTRIAKRYGQRPELLGISLLNEPDPAISFDLLDEYYRQARNAIERYCHPDVWYVMSDSFHHRKWRRRLPTFALDHHQYQVFTWLDKQLPARWQLLRARLLLPGKLKRMRKGHRLIIGEWSLVLKRSGTTEQTRQYGALQKTAFGHSAAAHFYWSYKTERPGHWNFRDCIERGLL